MVEEHDLYAHDGHACTVLVQGDYVWTTTSHSEGVLPNVHDPAQKEDYVHKEGLRPNLLVLDKLTGRLVARDNVAVTRVLHGQWSSLSMGEVDGRTLVFWGDGYGVLHAFEPPDSRESDEVQILRDVWRFDCNPKELRFDEDGNVRPYPTHKSPAAIKNAGPCNIIGTPVFEGGLIFLAIGRDWHYGTAPGRLWCIDPSGIGDITRTNAVWHSAEIGRTANTVAVADGLVVVADNEGRLHCLDAETGEHCWSHDLGARDFYCSPLVAEGKVYVGTCRGEFWILRASREKEVLCRTQLDAEVVACTAADGVLFVPTHRSLAAYARGWMQPDVFRVSER